MTDGPVRQYDTRSKERRPIAVGIGASAGGIKALQELFAGVAADSTASYVVVLHLSPEHESRLAEVLQLTSRLPVTQVTDRATIEPGHVYVVSPNSSLDIEGGQLVAGPMTRPEQRRAPVDVFFRALADAYGARAVCVVLSGTGPNGSAGLKRVKEYGGLAIAQDPQEAEYADMPRNSIATGLIDYVLRVADIPGAIAAYHRHLPSDDPSVPAPVTLPVEQEAMREILTLIRVRTGHDFSNYKPATLKRRIERRMNLRGLSTVAAYARAMRDEPNEALRLMRELLISVTNFFRDPDAFAALEQRIIPLLFAQKSAQDQLRVWVAGCATGEEAYSIAMLLAEYAAKGIEQPSLQVFATDLDEQAIGIAREGLYSEADVADLSEERLARFFTRETGGYRVRRELRELLLFAHHNVIKDPPFSHLDLISCRNLLIYLTRPIQERLVETFHFALQPGKYLFLGMSESPEGTNDLFLRVDPVSHIYESRTVSSRLALPLAETSFSLPRMPPRPAEGRPADRIAPADLHQRLLEQYASPSLLITEDHKVMHISERASRYLQMGAGEPTRDLLGLIRPELRPDLRTALHEAGRSRAPVAVRDARVQLEDGEHRVDMTIRPVLREGDPARGFFVVFFDEHTAPPEAEASAVHYTSPAEPPSRQLEEELSHVRAQLRATVEQYETQAEELRAGNEELQAMNEELRSAAEELETSKEELQSVNEELTTVNQELKIKIEELGLTNNDFQNFINATDIGTIFLDRALRVKLSTPKARQVFNLLDTDIGRPLTDITSRLMYDGIHADVRSVLDQLQNIEREVQTNDRRWHLMRVLPYRTMDNHIDGVVVTFQDITSRRQAEDDARAIQEQARVDLEAHVTRRTAELKQEVRAHSDAVRKRTEDIRRLIGANEDEHGRLSRLLHDDVGQQMTAMRLALERHQRGLVQGGLTNLDGEHLAEAVKLTAAVDRDVNFIAWRLRPAALDELGLAATVPRFVDTWSAREKVAAESRVEGYRAGALPPIVEIAFYRILQEALRNVAQHAEATRADVVLSAADGQVALVVEDDGVGFDVPAETEQGRGFGLTSMQERASLAGATLLIESTQGKGTSVLLRYPASKAASDGR